MFQRQISIYVKNKDSETFKVYYVDNAFVQVRNSISISESGIHQDDSLFILIKHNQPAFDKDGVQYSLIDVLNDDVYVAVDKHTESSDIQIDTLCDINAFKISTVRLCSNLQLPLFELRC